MSRAILMTVIALGIGVLAVLGAATSATFQVQAQEAKRLIPAAAALKVAEARVKIVQADLDAAISEEQYCFKEFKRATKLSGTGAIPDTEYNVSWRDHQNAKHKLAKARARLEEAKAMIEYVKAVGETDRALTPP